MNEIVFKEKPKFIMLQGPSTHPSKIDAIR